MEGMVVHSPTGPPATSTPPEAPSSSRLFSPEEQPVRWIFEMGLQVLLVAIVEVVDVARDEIDAQMTSRAAPQPSIPTRGIVTRSGRDNFGKGGTNSPQFGVDGLCLPSAMLVSLTGRSLLCAHRAEPRCLCLEADGDLHG